MDIYPLVQKLPEELVRVIASYDPTKELKRKQLKKSFEGIHHTAKWKLNISDHIGTLRFRYDAARQVRMAGVHVASDTI